MQPRHRPLGMRRGGDDEALVATQHVQPVLDIGRMVLPRLERQAEVGAQKGGPQFGDQLLPRIGSAGAAEVAAEPGDVARPVHAFVAQGRIVALRVAELLERRDLHKIG